MSNLKIELRKLRSGSCDLSSAGHVVSVDLPDDISMLMDVEKTCTTDAYSKYAYANFSICLEPLEQNCDYYLQLSSKDPEYYHLNLDFETLNFEKKYYVSDVMRIPPGYTRYSTPRDERVKRSPEIIKSYTPINRIIGLYHDMGVIKCSKCEKQQLEFKEREERFKNELPGEYERHQKIRHYSYIKAKYKYTLGYAYFDSMVYCITFPTYNYEISEDVIKEAEEFILNKCKGEYPLRDNIINELLKIHNAKYGGH